VKKIITDPPSVELQRHVYFNKNGIIYVKVKYTSISIYGYCSANAMIKAWSNSSYAQVGE